MFEFFSGIDQNKIQAGAGTAGVLAFALSVFNTYRASRANRERLEVSYGWDLDEDTNESFVAVSVANHGSTTAFIECVWIEDARGKRFQFFPVHGSVTTSRETILPGDRIPYIYNHSALRQLKGALGYQEITRVGARSTRSRSRRFRNDAGIYWATVDKSDRIHF